MPSSALNAVTNSKSNVGKEETDMSTRQQLDMLTFGVLILIVAILLITFGASGQWDKMISLTITLLGLWIMVSAGIRARNPSKYERGAYSTFVMGLLLLAVGGAWFVNIMTNGNIIFSIFLLLIVIGLLVIATALPTMRKKQQQGSQSSPSTTN